MAAARAGAVSGVDPVSSQNAERSALNVGVEGFQIPSANPEAPRSCFRSCYDKHGLPELLRHCASPLYFLRAQDCFWVVFAAERVMIGAFEGYLCMMLFISAKGCQLQSTCFVP